MKVKFVPQNVEFEILPGQSVMHLAQDHDLYIKSVCKGVPSCAECRVRVVDGEHNVLPPGSEELSLIGTGHFIDRRRLSCQLKCFGDITIDMTEQIAKQQGLIGGQKKKKLAIKDDRIEDTHAIRTREGQDGEESDSPEAMDGSGANSADSANDDVDERERDGESGDEVIEAEARPNSVPPSPGAQDQRGGRNRKRRRRGGRGAGPNRVNPDK